MFPTPLAVHICRAIDKNDFLSDGFGLGGQTPWLCGSTVSIFRVTKTGRNLVGAN